MRARALTAGMATLVAVAAVACGGGSDDAGPTRADYASKVNAICADRDDRIGELGGGIDDEDSVRQVITINEDALDQVREVEPPKDDRADVDALLSLIEDQNETLRGYADALAAGDSPDEADVVDELDAQAADFDAKATALGLDECTAGGASETDSTESDDAELDDAESATPALEDVAQTFIDYMDAYWSGDSDSELQLSTAWAGMLAGFHATADLSPAGAAPPEEAHVELSLTSIEEVADGYAVEGDITATTADTTYTYSGLLVVDDPQKGLVVADYCRTSPDGYGPLQGCLSDLVGNVDGDFTADDGSFHLAMGPVVRSLGYGEQYVDFSLCIDSLTTPVSVRGGLYATFVVGTDTNGLSGPGVVLAPAALGQRSCGYLQMQPPAGATDRSFPAGTLTFQVEKGDGTTVELDVTTPALPQPAGAL